MQLVPAAVIVLGAQSIFYGLTKDTILVCSRSNPWSVALMKLMWIWRNPASQTFPRTFASTALSTTPQDDAFKGLRAGNFKHLRRRAMFRRWANFLRPKMPRDLTRGSLRFKHESLVCKKCQPQDPRQLLERSRTCFGGAGVFAC